MNVVEPIRSIFLCDRPRRHLLAEGARGSRKEPA